MNISFMRSFMLGCLSSLLFLSAALADYHYVSHTGSDEYPYTSWETATDSVNAAVEAADPGDTVYIASGEYEGLVVMYPSDSLIAIIGAGMDSTHLFTELEHRLIYVGPKTYLKGMAFSTIWPFAAVWAEADGRDLTIEECHFIEGGWGIETGYAHVVVHNCIFENIEGTAIGNAFTTNLSLEISNCLFRDMQFEPINIWSHRAIIRNNIMMRIRDTTPITFHFVEGSYQGVSNNVIHVTGFGGIQANFDDSTSCIENNTIDRDYSYGISLYVPSFNWAMDNNTISNSGYGIWLASDYQLAVRYCNFFRNSGIWDFFVEPGYGGSFDTTYGLLHVDPMFVDSTDFHLQAFSPLIDAGNPAILDVDGTRSDIGAYGGPEGRSYIYQDLPPAIPDSLTYRVWNDTIYLAWRNNYEADFFGYQLHRDIVSGFTPSPLNLLAEPESSFYSDPEVILGETYYYRIASSDNQGNRSEYSPELAVMVTGVWNGEGAEMPRMTVIESNYPNPFNSSTTIVYSVANLGPLPAEITIEIYDITGRKIRTLIHERKEAGIHKIVWDGKDDSGNDLTSGTYFARISQWAISFMNKPSKLVLLK